MTSDVVTRTVADDDDDREVYEPVVEADGADMRYRTTVPLGRTTSHRPPNSLTF